MPSGVSAGRRLGNVGALRRRADSSRLGDGEEPDEIRSFLENGEIRRCMGGRSHVLSHYMWGGSGGIQTACRGVGPPCALSMDVGTIGIFIFARVGLVNAVLRAGGARPRRGGRRDDDARDRRRGLDRGDRRQRPVRARRSQGTRLTAACGWSSSNPRPRRERSDGFSGTAGGCLPATAMCGTCRQRRAR